MLSPAIRLGRSAASTAIALVLAFGLLAGASSPAHAADAKKSDDKKKTEPKREPEKKTPTPVPAGPEQTLSGAVREVDDGRGGKTYMLDIAISGVYYLDITNLPEDQAKEVKGKVGGNMQFKGVVQKKGSDAPVLIVTKIWDERAKLTGKPETISGKLVKHTDLDGGEKWALDKARNGFWYLDLSKLDENTRKAVMARANATVSVTGIVTRKDASDTPVIVVQSVQ